ncbi:phospholipase D-like domain-containing protein [Mixta theicola]|uniref:phospholipase D-like domain-containing protein n=1 Tax=Mixta theicola TaxID=1458355 RepID=UPI0013FD202B|nr:phospholipase D-like domain-containing protein [Mixta theicola]
MSCREPRVINNAEAHDACLTDILQLAQQRVVIVSPWVSLFRLRESGILSTMQQAVERDISVELYTDYRFNSFTNHRFDEEKNAQFKACCTELTAHGIAVRVVNKVHSKLLMADNNFICIGSYNWASAQRQGEYKNFETSLLYSGELKDEIHIQLTSLQERIRRDFSPDVA